MASAGEKGRTRLGAGSIPVLGAPHPSYGSRALQLAIGGDRKVIGPIVVYYGKDLLAPA
jgi:hypothetical protein